jgi:hypothetical protein
MKWYLGGGEQRLWLDPGEIETIAEDVLLRAGLMPDITSPVTDLERLIEGHLGADLDQYAELPDEVLGLSRFKRGKPPSVAINRALTAAALDDEDPRPGVLGRWRATLAHEAIHVMLHRALFDSEFAQASLFPGPESPADGLMRCLKRDVGYRSGTSDWREVQANMGMAALMMPSRLFKRVARGELAALDPTDAASFQNVVGRLAARFAVSKQAAEIRLGTLNLAGQADDNSLLGATGA